MSELNREVLRWVLLIGAAPIWLPFLRTLWRDFNDALREEGGLFGRPPSGSELERLRQERLEKPAGLPSEPIVRAGDYRRTRLGGRGRTAQSPAAVARPEPGARPRGFR